MNIKSIKTAFKVADVILDTEHPIRKIKFVFLKEIYDEKNNKIDNKILKDNSGRVYIIVSNGVIKKIGGSEAKGGIKSTMSSYQGGLQGGPSIRTYGIHLLISEELEKGNKVEIYIITSEKKKMKVKGLFDEKEIEVGAFRDMENRCKKDYKKIEGKYPPWNFQENGEIWRKDILRSHNIHGKKRKSLK